MKDEETKFAWMVLKVFDVIEDDEEEIGWWENSINPSDFFKNVWMNLKECLEKIKKLQQTLTMIVKAVSCLLGLLGRFLRDKDLKVIYQLPNS